MKGLILKDFYNLSNYKKVLVFFLIFYGFFGLITGSAASMFGMIIFMSAILTPSLFSYDEFSKWDSYALSLPVTRKNIVGARYTVSIILVGGSAVLTVIMVMLVQLLKPDPNIHEVWLSVQGMLTGAILFVSVITPICYKLGPEKGRIYMLAAVLIPVVGIFLLKQMGVAVPTQQQVELGLSVLLLISLLCFAASYFISCRIYEKKEF
ncbi:ABC-2 transporter permease [Hydrogenoanaerobacterium sp.]|uniref:ABC-2 transporter permease n=1 Tax=Hydrogenoanaerobacterium sp. TaxID=2953763 RepID=UPI0028962E61|nr:ABC-2 transporter permease [Hydrogenoanaerobacterium sp.]